MLDAITDIINCEFGESLPKSSGKNALDVHKLIRAINKSSLKNGYLEYSDKILKGKSKKQILLSTYLCHPQMANHELSGPLAWSFLYKIIKATGPHKYSYRFLVCPENIGAAAFFFTCSLMGR